MELTQGRSKLVAGRAVQAERLADLQREYERVLRIADLSRALSKENMAKAACAQTQLHSVRPLPLWALLERPVRLAMSNGIGNGSAPCPSLARLHCQHCKVVPGSAVPVHGSRGIWQSQGLHPAKPQQ